MRTGRKRRRNSNIDNSESAPSTLHFLYATARDPLRTRIPKAASIALPESSTTYIRTLLAARDRAFHEKQTPKGTRAKGRKQEQQKDDETDQEEEQQQQQQQQDQEQDEEEDPDVPLLSPDMARAALVRRRVATGRAWKRRRKTEERGNSPTHFFVDDEGEIPEDDDVLRQLMPDKSVVDLLLAGVSRLYYSRDVRPTQAGDAVWVTREHDELEYCTLDMLQNRLRRRNPLDGWSPLDIALFECGVCRVGKDFEHIRACLLPQKTTADLVEFYYGVWKFSRHYYAWKAAWNGDRAGKGGVHPEAQHANATVPHP